MPIINREKEQCWPKANKRNTINIILKVNFGQTCKWIHSWFDKINDTFLKVASYIKLRHFLGLVPYPKTKEINGKVGMASKRSIADLQEATQWLIDHDIP